MEDIYNIEDILPKLSDLHILYYFEKDKERYNICDEKYNSIVYNDTYQILQSCKVLEKETFSCVQINTDSTDEHINLYNYDNFMKDDGIMFNNKYILCHSNNQLKIEIENIIKVLYLDKEIDKIYGNGYRNIIEMLFTIVRNHNTREITQIITRDNFNIVNVFIFMNQFTFILDYINIHVNDITNSEDIIILNSISDELYLSIDKDYNKNIKEVFIELFKMMLNNSKTQLSIITILSYLYKKYTNKKNTIGIKNVILMYKIDSLLNYLLTNKLDLYDLSIKNIINAYKFCDIASKLSNYNKSIIKQYENDEVKYKNIKYHLDILKDVVKKDNIAFERDFFSDMIIMKYNIENNKYKLEKSILNKIFGRYYYFILNKSDKLFPISISSQIDKYNNISDKSKLYIEEYKKYRDNKETLKIEDTLYFNSEIGLKNVLIPGCGEACVYNYFNELLYDGNIINVVNFPEEYKHTDIYKFYNKNYNRSDENIEFQNTKISNKEIFTEFSYTIFNLKNIKYLKIDDSKRNIEIIPSAENIYNIIINVLNMEGEGEDEPLGSLDLQKSDNYLEKLKVLTENLCKKFNKKINNISINTNTFIFNNLKIIPGAGHCSSESSIYSEDKKYPKSYDYYYTLYDNSRIYNDGICGYKCDDYNDILTLKLTHSNEIFNNRILPYIITNYDDIIFLKEIIEPALKNINYDNPLLNLIMIKIYYSDFKITKLPIFEKLDIPYTSIIYIIKYYNDIKINIKTICKIFKSIDYKFVDNFFTDVCRNDINKILSVCGYNFSDEIYEQYYGKYDVLVNDDSIKILLTKYKYYNYLFKRSNDLLELSKITTQSEMESFTNIYEIYYFKYTYTTEQLCVDIKSYFCDNFEYFKNLIINNVDFTGKSNYNQYKPQSSFLDFVLSKYTSKSIDKALEIFLDIYKIEDIMNLSNNYRLFIIFLNLNRNNKQLLKNILEYFDTHTEYFYIGNMTTFPHIGNYKINKYYTFDLFHYKNIINQYINDNNDYYIIIYPDNTKLYYINSTKVNKTQYDDYIAEMDDLYS